MASLGSFAFSAASVHFMKRILHKVVWLYDEHGVKLGISKKQSRGEMIYETLERVIELHR